MDITLIFPRSEFLIDEDVFPPLGILYLATYLKNEGFSVQCLDMGLGHTIDDIQSDVVGISFTTPQRQVAYDIVKQLKGNKFLIAGGPHPTHMTEECLEHGFDCVVQGYGEEGLYQVMKRLKNKEKVPSIIERNNFIDFDEFPIPDRSFLSIKDYKYKINDVPATVLMTSRGCPYNCSFCARIDPMYDYRTAEQVAEEMIYLEKTYGYKGFQIFDDIFVLPNKRLLRIAEIIKDRGYTIRCFVRSNLVNDELAKTLKSIGVHEVGIGIESGSHAILNKNMKGTTTIINSGAVGWMKQNGIRVKAFMIVGLPGESHHTIKQTKQWLREAKPDDVDVTIFQPLPGSNIFKNPGKFDVEFYYNSHNWYKGKPGEYHTTVSTQFLSSTDIVKYRDEIEREFKKDFI